MQQVLREEATDGTKLVLSTGEWVWADPSKKHFEPSDCGCGTRVAFPDPDCPQCGEPLKRTEVEYSQEELVRMIATSIRYGIPHGHGFSNPRACKPRPGVKP